MSTPERALELEGEVKQDSHLDRPLVENPQVPELLEENLKRAQWLREQISATTDTQTLDRLQKELKKLEEESGIEVY